MGNDITMKVKRDKIILKLYLKKKHRKITSQLYDEIQALGQPKKIGPENLVPKAFLKENDGMNREREREERER